MSFSGAGRRDRKEPLQAYNMRRVAVQVLEVLALMVFFVGMGLGELAVMAAGAALGWGATAMAYRNFQDDIVRRSPDRRDAMSVPKASMYIAFTVAAALSLMTVLSVFA